MSNNSCKCDFSQNEKCTSLILCLLTDDLLYQIHARLTRRHHKNSFRQVCRTFHRVDSLTRTHLRPLHHSILPTLLPNLPSLTSLDLSLCPRVDDSLATALAPTLRRMRVRTLNISRSTALTRVGLETIIRACGDELEVVDVSYWCRRFSDNEAVALSCAVAAREIRVDKGLSVTDVGLARVAVGCVRLEKLSLKWCMEITDIGVHLLTKKCLGLKFLDISSLKITSESLSSIASLQMLESLIMAGCTSVDDVGLHLLGNGCPSLKALDVSRCDGITSAGLCSVVRGHPDLLQLSISHCMVDLTTFDLLRALKGLTHLNVFRADGARVSHATFQILSTECRSLVEIGLSKCVGMKDVDIVRLVNGCTALTVLNLSCCDAVTDTTIAAIAASCLKLCCLMLESCSSMTEMNLQLLGFRCIHLEELDVTDCCGINDTALGFLSRCVKLKSLKLGLCNNISDKGLSYLASKCKDITELDLYRCPGVGDEGMAALSRGCKNLKKLNVSYCSGLTDKGMEYIGALEELYDLEMRSLMNVTGIGLQAVASGCKRLAQLDLKCCSNIQDSGFWALANYSKNIWQLNLCESAISDVALLMVMTNLICLQDAKLVNLSRVSARGFELSLRAGGVRLKKVKLNTSLKFTLSRDILHFLWSRGCKIRWD
ncbi:hypothetical protein RND81_04G208700 [Saponaria officinalis]|uniref:F-box/LRR-repeat protein 15-like leucin rich repeat domain-containing protein n=2 Tax=Saponaria officinalis TaxID=3572 RepID=A0AAW1LN94_SAPOF